MPEAVLLLVVYFIKHICLEARIRACLATFVNPHEYEYFTANIFVHVQCQFSAKTHIHVADHEREAGHITPHQALGDTGKPICLLFFTAMGESRRRKRPAARAWSPPELQAPILALELDVGLASSDDSLNRSMSDDSLKLYLDFWRMIPVVVMSRLTLSILHRCVAIVSNAAPTRIIIPAT
jgi:hypothetical protein